jgi:hypothetical protein
MKNAMKKARRKAVPALSVSMKEGDDLARLSKGELVQEVIRLRNGIRKHRDSSRHELCWYHPQLWGLLPEKTDPDPVVPTWPRFLEGCLQFRKSLDEQAKSARRTAEPYKGEKAKREKQKATK